VGLRITPYPIVHLAPFLSSSPTTWSRSQPQPFSQLKNLSPKANLRSKISLLYHQIAVMSEPPGDCLYDILGVSKSATASELETAHRKLALLVHPDRLFESSDAEKSEGEAQMKAINHANDILGDPTKRAEYDASCRAPKSGIYNPQITNRRTRRSKANTPKPTRPTLPNLSPQKRKRKAADNDNECEEFFRKRN
jgi:hypothetical protein